ncbi:MAG: alpha/beta fold hydrolase [Rhodobacterales bacterium]|nr:alpha/beta fold hydrolase [Rhodobacterales bacterium]
MFILKIIAISVVIPMVIAVGLVLSQTPVTLTGKGGLDFSEVGERRTVNILPRLSVPMRDGVNLGVSHVAALSPDAPLLILIHGSGWHGMQFNQLASDLSDTAEILIPDLRGHGENPVRRGDVDYIGQLEDDIADLVRARAKPGQKVILGGHSSGGGLVVRFAGGANGDLIDGAVLLAPFLKYNAPTTRQSSGGWARVLTRRLIGLSMLNMAGIKALNHLTVIQFQMPKNVLDGPLGHTATTAYSYRMNTSFAPRNDYLADIAKLPDFLLVTGTNDEAFFADQYQPLMSENTGNGQYHLVEGVSHLGIVDAPETQVQMRAFINGIIRGN